MDLATTQRLRDGRACLEAALRYLKLGWAVLALCPPDHVGVAGVSPDHVKRCQQPGKVPWHRWAEFQDRLPTEDEVRGWWRRLPNSNLGMALGPVSHCVRVDVEGPASEEALRAKSAGDLPETLEFTSGRGRGLLYGLPDGVPLRTTRETFGRGQELRIQARGAQTALPPSRHHSGALYAWLAGRGPDDRAIAPAPAWLLLELAMPATNGHAPRGNPLKLFEGVPEGGRNDSMASVIGRLAAALRDPDDDGDLKTMWLSVEAINERNDPPLDRGELLEVFSSIVRREQAQRHRLDLGRLGEVTAVEIAESCEQAAAVPPSRAQEPASLPPWHLIEVASNPPRFLLRSPFWSGNPKVAATRGYITLTAHQLAFWGSIITCAVEQAGARPPDRLREWGSSLLQQLLDHCGHESAPLEDKRNLLVLEFLYARLGHAPDARVDDDGTVRLGAGAPTRLPDGKVIVKSGWLTQEAAFKADKIKRGELTAGMLEAGMQKEILGPVERRGRWWTITADDLKALADAVLDTD